MDQGTESKWERRIQALLRKAESTKHEEERQALLEKVEELIVKWGLDRAVLEAKAWADGEEAKIVVRSFRLDGLRGRTRDDILIVYNWLRNGLGNLRAVIYEDYDAKQDRLQKCLKIIGFESDVEAFAMLAASIQMQMISGAAIWWKDEVMRDQGCRGFPAHVRSAKKSGYMMGFAEQVYLRLRDIRIRSQQEYGGSGSHTDLVLIDRGSRVDDFYEREFPNLGKARASKRRHDLEGFVAGSRDGANADLGQKRFANRREMESS